MDTEARIRAYDRYFARVQPPLASSPDVKEVLDALTKSGYFITICDEAFGPMRTGNETLSRAAVEASQTEYYWMDEANNSAEDSPLCTALMSLLGPNGSLFSIMEQISAPSTHFNTMLKGSWRGEGNSAGPCANDQPYRSTSLLPLPALCDFSTDILNENPDHDLASLPRERVVPLLLLPFWDPPLDLRTVVGKAPQRDSLQSTMMAHFLFRMMSYANTRCAIHGRTILLPPPPTTTDTIHSWIEYCQKLIMGKEITNRPSTQKFHFYKKLVLEYMRHFVRPATIERFNTRSYAAHCSAGWTEKEIMALITLQGPATMWLHRSNRPISEYERVRLTDPCTIALAAQSLWMLEAAFVHLEGEVDGKGIIADTRDYGVVASADLMWPLRTCYRSCLVAIRTMAMSLPYVQSQDSIYLDLIRLWRAVITSPCNADANGMSTYFFHHFEAFSILFVEILEMAQSRAFVEVASATTITTLRKAVDEFTFDPIPSMLQSVTDLVAANGKELDRIRRWNVLDWSRSDGAPSPVIAPLGEEARNAAGRVFLRFTATIATDNAKLMALPPPRSGKSSDAMVTALTEKVAAMESVIESLKKVFRTLAEDGELLKSQPSPLRQRQGMNSGLFNSVITPTTGGSSLPFPAGACATNMNSVGGSAVLPPTRYHNIARLQEEHAAQTGRRNSVHTLSEADRKGFLLGIHSSTDFTRSSRLRFGNSVVTADSYEVLRSHEMPFMIPVVKAIDTVIDFAQYTTHTRHAQRCTKGHTMSLAGDSRSRCCNHSMNRAVFECDTCRLGYCESCNGPSAMGDGRRIRSCLPITLGCRSCDRCGVLFGDSSVGYVISSRNKTFWCAGCVSRPWKPVSVRFLASRRTYAIVILVAILYFALAFFSTAVFGAIFGEHEEGPDETYETYWDRAN